MPPYTFVQKEQEAEHAKARDRLYGTGGITRRLNRKFGGLTFEEMQAVEAQLHGFNRKSPRKSQRKPKRNLRKKSKGKPTRKSPRKSHRKPTRKSPKKSQRKPKRNSPRKCKRK